MITLKDVVTLKKKFASK